MTRFYKHYLPLIAVVIITGIFFYYANPDIPARTFVARVTGYTSLIILAFSLIIGPVNIILKKKNPISTYFRRDISITGGILAVIHSVTGLSIHLRGKPWLYFMEETEAGLKFRVDRFGFANYTGLLSALLIIFLLVLSNDYFLKRMNINKWKNIQRFSYLMFILALAHSILYRVPNKNSDLIWYLYVPLLLIVLILQLGGMMIKTATIKK